MTFWLYDAIGMGITRPKALSVVQDKSNGVIDGTISIMLM